MKQITKLEDSKPWRKAIDIAVDAYATIEDLPKEEEWDMKVRLHQHAFGLTDELAAAYGSLDPRDRIWQLGKARSHLLAIKNAYILSYKSGQLPEKSEVIVLMNECVALIDEELADSDVAIQSWYELMREKKESAS